jgi:hypothetical protein
MKNLLLSALLALGVVGGVCAEPSQKLYVRGELLKGGDSVLHFADAVKSGEDTTLSSLIQNSYLNAADESGANTKLVQWPYVIGVMLKLNPMLAGDGSVMLTVHGFQSSVGGTKKNPSHPELDMPEVVYKAIDARSILDQGVQKDLVLGGCLATDKKPADCTYTLRITVTGRK